MKILYFTDSHIRGTTPKNRTDDFTNTLELKFKEILDIIKEEKIDYVLHGGDLFDRPDVSISLVSKFSKILKQIPVPMYIISGNHDIFGHNPKTLKRSMLGLISDLDVLNIISENKKILLEKNGIKIQLTGSPYTYNIDRYEDNSPYIIKDVDKSCDYSIHLVHGMLLDKPFIKGVPHTLVDDIKATKADVTLAGHYHSGFKKIKIDGKIFLNPGSIVRVSNSLKEIKRKPKVVIMNFKESIDISYKYLNTALDGEKVLDRKEIEDSIYRREKMYDFKQSIDSAMSFEKMDINDVLLEVSNSEGVEDKVKKEALKRISQIQMNNIGE